MQSRTINGLIQDFKSRLEQLGLTFEWTGGTIFLDPILLPDFNSPVECRLIEDWDRQHGTHPLYNHLLEK